MADSEMDNDDVGFIRPIEQESIRRIVAGQAVSDLASAVKELVDNALDAGSKSINSTFVVAVFFCCCLGCFSVVPSGKSLRLFFCAVPPLILL